LFITASKGSGKHCGHEHASFEEAQKCLMAYAEEMRKKSKLSDRIIVEVNSIEDFEDDIEFY
jgi:hypothetical protein